MIKIQHKMELKVVLKQSMLLVRLEKDGEKERRTKFQFRYFLTNLKGLMQMLQDLIVSAHKI